MADTAQCPILSWRHGPASNGPSWRVDLSGGLDAILGW